MSQVGLETAVDAFSRGLDDDPLLPELAGTWVGEHGQAECVRIPGIDAQAVSIPFICVNLKRGGQLRSQATQHALQRRQHVPLGKVAAEVELVLKIGAVGRHRIMMPEPTSATQDSGGVDWGGDVVAVGEKL